MAFIVDTNVLLRGVQPHHSMHREAVEAVALLLQRGEEVSILPQIVVEFWCVCTRPAASNGLGLTTAQTETEVRRVESVLTVLAESSSIYHEWRKLVFGHKVSGVHVHDARIVAAMKTHGVTHILTFNESDFRRFHGITVVTPTAALSET